QVERGIVEVLIHGIEVKGCRLETLIEGYEPVRHVGLGDLGRKRYAGERIFRKNHVGRYAERSNAESSITLKSTARAARAEYRCGARHTAVSRSETVMHV